jgi:hypothetical protein
MKSSHFPSTVRAAGVVLSVLCSLLFVSCDESLPPRDDPSAFLVATTQCDYYISRTEEAMYITLKVRNTYTEVLSDTATVVGDLLITWRDEPGYEKHVVLTAGDIKKYYFNPRTGLSEATKADYIPASKILTIPEGEYVALQYRWNLLSDDSSDIRKIAMYHKDPINPSLYRTDSLSFSVTASVHLFDKAPRVYPRPLITRQQLSKIL